MFQTITHVFILWKLIRWTVFFIFFLSEYIKHFISIYSNDKINCGNIENDFQGCLKFPKNNVIAKILKNIEKTWTFMKILAERQTTTKTTTKNYINWHKKELVYHKRALLKKPKKNTTKITKEWNEEEVKWERHKKEGSNSKMQERVRKGQNTSGMCTCYHSHLFSQELHLQATVTLDNIKVDCKITQQLIAHSHITWSSADQYNHQNVPTMMRTHNWEKSYKLPVDTAH